MRTAGDVLATKGSNVYWIDPLASVFDALKEMNDKNVGALCVMIDEYLVGIVSERDYVRHVILDRNASEQTKVSEIMTRDVIKVNSDAPIDECLSLMKEHGFRHLPVVGDDGKMIGIISIGDVVNSRLAELEAESESLRHSIEARRWQPS